VLARNNLAVAYLDEGDVDAAIGELTKATAADPEFATAYKNLTVAYCKKIETLADDDPGADRTRFVGLAMSNWEAYSARHEGAFDDEERKISQMIAGLEGEGS